MDYTPSSIHDEMNKTLAECRRLEQIIYTNAELSEMWQIRLVGAIRAHYDPIIKALDDQMKVAMWWLERQGGSDGTVC